MKKIEEITNKNIVTYILINFILFSFMAMIIWPLLDMVMCKYITNSEFNYTVSEYIGKPIFFAFIISIIFGIIHKQKKN